ncbi:MAG: ABC transporter permease [Sandaracinaceae bacterium]|jgi:ABC-2 type transport system permease protein|nr:ABC transporter permease [Sandaracinaceae bacterium]
MSTAAATQSAFAQDFATVSVLWRRDIVRFFRERTRVVGALVQPLIFWFVIGSGLSPTFHMEAAADVSYMAYFFPGVILMVVLFTSIFATMSLIEDRHNGFMQAVLVGPGSRGAVVLGKSLGSTTVALVQASLFVLLAPLAGFGYASIDWPMLAFVLLLTSLALTTTGFAVAWWLDSTQGYHVVMSVLLLPLWIMSGAMFPAPRSLQRVLAFNPMSHSVGALRRALYGGMPPAGTVLASAGVELGVLIAFAITGFAFALVLAVRKR